MTARVNALIADLGKLSRNELALRIRTVVGEERADELERFLICDDRPSRDEIVALDERELIAKIVERLRDEFDVAFATSEIPSLVVACTRPADSVFDRAGYDLAFVPRPE